MSWSAIFLLIFVGTTCLRGQYAYFDSTTDTIAVSGGTTISSSAMTMEAVFVLTAGSTGSLYFEEVSGLEHKQLYLGDSLLGGFAFTFSVPTAATVSIPVTLNVPHHFAFVQSSARRMLLDGLLVYEDFSAGASIANSPAHGRFAFLGEVGRTESGH
ncbi:MAG: hypothetical protein EXS38_04895 [Opitutus sp.]|nr:hypothetical protein [Opitutus sp.]